MLPKGQIEFETLTNVLLDIKTLEVFAATSVRLRPPTESWYKTWVSEIKTTSLEKCQLCCMFVSIQMLIQSLQRSLVRDVTTVQYIADPGNLNQDVLLHLKMSFRTAFKQKTIIVSSFGPGDFLALQGLFPKSAKLFLSVLALCQLTVNKLLPLWIPSIPLENWVALLLNTLR